MLTTVAALTSKLQNQQITDTAAYIQTVRNCVHVQHLCLLCWDTSKEWNFLMDQVCSYEVPPTTPLRLSY